MGKLSLALLAMSASVVVLGAAQAQESVTVWGGFDTPAGTANPLPNNPGAQNGAQDPAPTNSAVATFTYTGPVDWVNPSPQNTTDTGNLFNQFFNVADITSFTSPSGTYTGGSAVTNFGNSSMSIDGDRYWTYIQVTGTTAGGTATISHDDGASVYNGTPGSMTAPLYNSPAETSEITSPSFTIKSGPYYIDYIEGNGSPADLVFSTTTSAIPEPSTWAMMLLGFAGLAYAGLRGRKTSVAALA